MDEPKCAEKSALTVSMQDGYVEHVMRSDVFSFFPESGTFN